MNLKLQHFFSTLALALMCAPLFGQSYSQKELDSLQDVLVSKERKDLRQIVELGNRIARNSKSDKQKFEVYSFVSEVYFSRNDIDKSVFYLFKAKDAAEESDNPGLLAQAYGSIANQYSYLNLTEKARNYLDLARKQIERLPEDSYKHKLKALAYLELGNLDFNDKEYAKANASYTQSLREFNSMSDKKQLNLYHFRRSLYNIGNSYYYLTKSDSAEIYLNRALAIKDIQNPDLKYYIYSTLAEVYSQKKQYSRAIDTLQAVIKDSAFAINSLKTEIYLNLASNYKSIGDDRNYSLYNEKYIALKNAVTSQDLKAINTVIDAEHDDLKSHIKRSDDKIRWLVYSVGIVVILSIIVLIVVNLRKKKEKRIYQSIIEKLENQVAAFAQADEKDLDTPEEEPRYTISPAVEQAILEGLQKFESEQQYRNADLTLPNLATQLKTNPAYLSAVIKNNKHNNFNGYVNELRIRYICEKLHGNPEYLNYKISYLAEDCGFVSHSAFSTIFKKVTGIAPSAFISQARKN